MTSVFYLDVPKCPLRLPTTSLSRSRVRSAVCVVEAYTAGSSPVRESRTARRCSKQSVGLTSSRAAVSGQPQRTVAAVPQGARVALSAPDLGSIAQPRRSRSATASAPTCAASPSRKRVAGPAACRACGLTSTDPDRWTKVCRYAPTLLQAASAPWWGAVGGGGWRTNVATDRASAPR